MTDLISSLADSIVALINASPCSPTKAEIEATVRPIIDADHARRVANAASFVAKARAAGWKVSSGCQGETPSVSQAMLDAKHAAYEKRERAEAEAAKRMIAGNMVEAIEQDERDRDAWDEKERAAHKLLGYEGPTTKERLERAKAMMHLIETMPTPVLKADRPCAASSDGTHAYVYDMVHDDYRCTCGARAHL